jgi:chromate transport protein ChrA
MATSKPESAEGLHDDENSVQTRVGLWPLTGYLLKLGTVGFGGPVALVGFMHRDLVEKRRWITEDTYKLSLALAQIMPGPLAAQVAIAIGYFEGGILGATLGGLAFVIPSFLMVLAISLAYVTYGGLWWMQALFYAIGATVIAIVAIAAYKLARSTNKRDPLLWGIFVLLTVVTVWAQAELAEFFIFAGMVVLLVRAWPGWTRGVLMGLSGVVLGLAIWFLEFWLRQAGTAADSQDVLVQILLFFTKAGACVRQRLGDHSVFATRGSPTIRLAERTSIPGRSSGSDDHPWPRGYHCRFYRLSRCRLGRLYHGGDRHLSAGLLVYHCPGALVQTPPRQPSAQGLRRRRHRISHRRDHRGGGVTGGTSDHGRAHGTNWTHQPRRLMALQSSRTGDRHYFRGRWIDTLAVSAGGVTITSS